MSGSKRPLSAEITISDPWDVAAVIQFPIPGTVLRLEKTWAVVKLDHPVWIHDVLARSAIASARHIGSVFRRSEQPIPANIVLCSSDLPPQHDLEAAQRAAAAEPHVVALGGLILTVK